MPSDAENNLHGNVPDQASTCLLINDMINPLTFEGAEQMLPAISAVAERIAVLKKRMKAAHLPLLYAMTILASGSRISQARAALLGRVVPRKSDHSVTASRRRRLLCP